MENVSPPAEALMVVFVHVHYPEIWQEMSVLLADRLRLPFHLVLTGALSPDDTVLPKTPALLSARIVRTENRGRDILPFLHALAKTDGFDIGLKLHTKKSPQREDGALWRAEILDSLLPAGVAVEAIVARIRANQRIGIVAPAGFCLSVKPWVLMNTEGMNSIMSTLGVDAIDPLLEHAYFAAGSMFWFRRPALVALTDVSVMALFEAETGQTDGTIAHAMERLFPVEARRRGYVSLAVPALALSHANMSEAELMDLARCHANVPNRYFPAPYIPALPLELTTRAPSKLSRFRALVMPIYRILPVGLRHWLHRLIRR